MRRLKPFVSLCTSASHVQYQIIMQIHTNGINNCKERGEKAYS